jgi:hypothetical protein
MKMSKIMNLQDLAILSNGMVQTRGPQRCAMCFWSFLSSKFFPNCHMEHFCFCWDWLFQYFFRNLFWPYMISFGSMGSPFGLCFRRLVLNSRHPEPRRVWKGGPDRIEGHDPRDTWGSENKFQKVFLMAGKILASMVTTKCLKRCQGKSGNCFGVFPNLKFRCTSKSQVRLAEYSRERRFPSSRRKCFSCKRRRYCSSIRTRYPSSRRRRFSFSTSAKSTSFQLQRISGSQQTHQHRR